jgi:hypothetical protein
MPALSGVRAMRRGQSYLRYHFIVLVLLSVVAQIPAVVLILTLLTIGVGGLVLAAAPTVLLYSIALLPLWIAATNRPRRYWQIAGALLIPTAVAIGPRLLSYHGADRYGRQLSRDDFARPSTRKPKTIEIVGDYGSEVFQYAQEVGDKRAACGEICRRLLFNREVEQVRMTRLSEPTTDARSAPPQSVTYHLEHRDSCPQVYSAGIQVDKAFRDRLIAGDCLVVGADSGGPKDATVSLTTIYSPYYPVPPEEAPAAARIAAVKRLTIEQRGEDGAAVPIVLRNEVSVEAVSLPFHFGYELHLGTGGYNGQTIGRSVYVINRTDLAAAVRETFGFKVAAVEVPAAEPAPNIADRVLSSSREASPSFSAAQQESISDVLGAMRRQPSLSGDDVEFVRRVVADPRINEARLGGLLLDLFRRHPARLEPLAPVIIERLKIPVPEQVGHYNNSLGWALASFPAEVLLPYRDPILAIVEAQNEWPTTGMLTRVGELGSDTSDLIVRRLDAKSDTVRQFAAVATCRAADDIWAKIEPAVLARLNAEKGRRVPDRDRDRRLMLALVRHGKKAVAMYLAENSEMFDKAQLKVRLSRFEPGFSTDHCGDFF